MSQLQKAERLTWLWPLLAMVAGLLAVMPVESFDTFWQLASGREMVQQGAVLRVDTFSLVSDSPRWEHCWLHDVLLYVVYLLGGYEGLSLLKGLLVGLTFGVLLHVARIRGAGLAVSATVAFAVFPLVDWAWLLRPQLWSYLAFALALILLERSALPLWRWLLLVVLWGNLHAGALLALPLALARAGGGLIESRGRRWRGALLLSLSTPLALCVTPYGTRIFQGLASATAAGGGDTAALMASNLDWRSTTYAAFPEFYWLLVGVVLVLALSRFTLSFAGLFIWAGVALMGLVMERHTPFFVLASVAFLPPLLSQLSSRFLSGPRGSVCRKGFVFLAVGVVLWGSTRHVEENGWPSAGLKRWHYPVEIAEFVPKHKIPGNLFNSYAYGGYLIWQLYPDYRVFWDGRQTSVSMYRLGRQVASGAPGWDAVLDEFGVNQVILELCSLGSGRRSPLLDPLVESGQWVPVLFTEASALFVRTSSVPPPWLERHRMGAKALDDALLSAASLVLRDGPWRAGAYWEVARILLKRRQYRDAFGYLDRYLRSTPPQQRLPEAVASYEWLSRLLR